jgi:hypothetical protein
MAWGEGEAARNLCTGLHESTPRKTLVQSPIKVPRPSVAVVRGRRVGLVVVLAVVGYNAAYPACDGPGDAPCLALGGSMTPARREQPENGRTHELAAATEKSNRR